MAWPKNVSSRYWAWIWEFLKEAESGDEAVFVITSEPRQDADGWEEFVFPDEESAAHQFSRGLVRHKCIRVWKP